MTTAVAFEYEFDNCRTAWVHARAFWDDAGVEDVAVDAAWVGHKWLHLDRLPAELRQRMELAATDHAERT